MTERADPEKLVRYLITSLVDNPDDVAIETDRTGDNVTFTVTVNNDDVGKVIGRQGRVIKAIRTLVRAAASVDDGHAEVEIMG
jgi:predicted RNA-binding protein YlqC (UPF0109 family)